MTNWLINKFQRDTLEELYEIAVNLMSYFDDSRADRI